MSLVEIRDVDKHFGPLQVLKRVSLDVAEGEIVAIIGRSGSGKSTLLRCINGLEPIQGGTIRVDSDLVNAPKADLRKLRQKVGIVFQSYNLFPHLTVELQMQQITGINRIPFLVTDKVDIVIAVMGATPERAKQIMFSSPYASLYIGVFGPQDLPVSSADGIGDYTVGVPRGTTQDISITEMAPDANIVRFEDDATTAAAYLSGQVDLFGTANILVQDMVKKNPDLDLVNKFVIRRSPAHMGVRHGEFNLLRWLDTFIFYSKMNGTLEQLHQKWMGESMKPMPSF